MTANHTTTAAEFAEVSVSSARLTRQAQAAAKRDADRKASPDAWKGWKLDDIARAALPTFTRDEDGEIWA